MLLTRLGRFSIPEVSILLVILLVSVSVLVSTNYINTLTDTNYNTLHSPHFFSFLFNFILFFKVLYNNYIIDSKANSSFLAPSTTQVLSQSRSKRTKGPASAV